MWSRHYYQHSENRVFSKEEEQPQKKQQKNTHNVQCHQIHTTPPTQSHSPIVKVTESVPMSNSLGFVQVKVTPSLDTSPPITVIGLCDTGANSTIMDVSVFKAHSVLHQFKYTPPSSKSVISLASQDAVCTIRGYVEAFLVFNDSRGCQIPIFTRIVLATGLKHHLYIGTNILMSSKINCLTPKGLMFTSDALAPSNSHSSVRRHTHLVPYLTPSQMKPYFRCKGMCNTIRTHILQPHQTQLLTCTLTDASNLAANTVLVTTRATFPKQLSPLVLFSAQYTIYGDTPTVDVIAYNNGSFPIYIPPDFHLANYNQASPTDLQLQQLTCIYNATTIRNNKCQISLQSISDVSCSDIFLDGKAELPYTTEARRQLQETGLCQLPLTSMLENIENKRSVGVAIKKGAATADEVADLIPMSHLTKEQKSIVRQLVHRHRAAFAATLDELPETPLLTLTAQLKDNVDLDKLQVRYKDIPLADRKEVQEILSQMMNAGIIAKCTGDILLVSNLLTRRKKSGKLRMILDNRTANAITKKLTDIGCQSLISHMCDLRHAALATTADLSNSFFQIPTSPFLSSLLCFRGPDRTLYQMNRCAQGYINSSAALNTAVSRMKEMPVFTQELSGILPLPIRTRPLTFQEARTYSQPIPVQTIGAFAPTHAKPKRSFVYYTDMTYSQLRHAHLVIQDDHCAIQNYMDDLIVHSPHYSHSHHLDHQSSLTPYKNQELTRPPFQPERKDQQTTDGSFFLLPSGRRIYTDECRHCAKNDNGPPSRNDFLYHMQQFEILLIKLIKAGLRISPQKTHIASNRVELLGSIWRPGRMTIADVRLQALRNMKINSVKSLHSALASLSYHRMQIPQFSKLAHPLLEIIKNKKFKWTETEHTAWQKLLEQLAQNSSLHLFDPNKEVVISSDASQHAAACTLTQECHGKQRLVACVSRTFTSSEKHASIMKKEVLGAIYAFDSFAFLIQGCSNITLEIDSRALQFVRFCKDSNPYMMRLSLMLSEYGINKIIHTPSQCHETVDSLSRLTPSQTKFKNLLDDYDPMTPREAEILVRKIAIPAGKVFTPSQAGGDFEEMFEGDSLPSCLKATDKRTPVLPTKRPLKLAPKLIRERTVRPPFGLSKQAKTPDSKWRKPKYLKKAIVEASKTAKKRNETRHKQQVQQHRVEVHNPTVQMLTRQQARRQQISPSSEIHAPHPTLPPNDHENLTPELVPQPNDTVNDTASNRDNPENEYVNADTHDNQSPPRSPIPRPLPADDEQPAPQSTYDHIRICGRIVQDGILSLKTYNKLLREDEHFSAVYRNLHRMPYSANYVLSGDTLFFRRGARLPRLCVPTILLETIIRQHHTTPGSAHQAYTPLHNLLKSKYYHPQLAQITRKICDACTLCQVKLTHPLHADTLGRLPIAEKRAYWYCDLAKVATDPICQFFIAVDSYSLYTFIYPMDDKAENSLQKAVLQLAATFHPRTLKFDNESAAIALSPKMKEFGIEFQFTAVGSSFSNGIVERRVDKIKELVRVLRAETANITNHELATLIQANLNRRILDDKQLTAEQIMYSNSLALPDDVVRVSTDETTPLHVQQDEFRRAIQQFQRAREKRAEQHRQHRRPTRRQLNYQQGDVVWCSNKNLIQGEKNLRATRTGPYIVERIEPGEHTAVIRHTATNAIIKRRLNYLVPANDDFTNMLISRSWRDFIIPPPAH